MSQAAFHRRVDEYIDAGMTRDQAISQAGYDAAHYVDPFDKMRQDAIGSR